jgi:hypothetical protein
VWAEHRKHIEYDSFLAFTFALSLLALGTGKMLYLDGILVVLVTGVIEEQCLSVHRLHCMELPQPH